MAITILYARHMTNIEHKNATKVVVMEPKAK